MSPEIAERLRHGTNCRGRWGEYEDCTCGLKWRERITQLEAELKRIGEDKDYLFRANVGNDWEERLQVQKRMIEMRDREIARLEAALREAGKDTERLDWLANEVDREMSGIQKRQSLFRRNQPITREAIDA